MTKEVLARIEDPPSKMVDLIGEIIDKNMTEGEGLNLLHQNGISISNLEYYRELDKYKRHDTLSIIENKMWELFREAGSTEDKIMILREIANLSLKRKGIKDNG